MIEYQKKKPEKEKSGIAKGTGNPAELSENFERQIAWAAGTEAFAHRDPSYHLSESFTKRFDAVGKARAAGWEQEPAETLADPSRKARKEEEAERSREDYAGHPWFSQGETDMGDRYVARSGEEDRLARFSEIGFQRGSLSSAVLNGTGKMMMVSCLKRTVGQENAKSLRERKLFQMHSEHRMVPGGRGSLGIVNKGFADSAQGLVLDVVKDARLSLENLEKMVRGEVTSDGKSGTGTLWKMYPFLDQRREEMLLAGYEEKLRDPRLPEGSEERQAVLSAKEKVTAVLRKKEQTKREFLAELRKLRERAVEAELLFGKEDLLYSAAQTVTPAAPPEGKPEKEPDREETEEVKKTTEEKK